MKYFKKLNTKGFAHVELVLLLIVIAVVGGIGTYMLKQSHAATFPPVYVQTSNGCWLAGRNWNASTASCGTGCRSGAGPLVSIKGVNGDTRYYCTQALAPWTSVSETACDNLHRKFVYDIGCSRRVDQTNTLNARQCQAGYPYYIASGSPDRCVVQTTARAVAAIDTTNKDTVNNAYKSIWVAGQSAANDWTGSVSTCNPGNISSKTLETQTNAVNMVRAMAGLDNVEAAGLGSTAQAGVQKAALMMEANNALSHSPPSSWKCFSAAGATAASQSNLALAYSGTTGISPIEGIKLYMSEPGGSNNAVGHRRWILNPDATEFAFGLTHSAAATNVTSLGTDTSNTDPAWVGWPSKGYFPDALEPSGKWSLSAGGSAFRFTNATVSVTHNGSAVAVQKYAPDLAYARPTVVWQMPSGFSKTGTYTVNVSNITKVGSSSTYSTTYNVVFFTPY